MKKSILKYLFYLTLFALIIIYLFPGSLIGYILYGDIGKQPNFITSPIGTSINHLIYFFCLTILGLIIKLDKNNFLNKIYFIFSISIILELFHLFIPNRSFEYYDLFANLMGVLLGIFMYKILLWVKQF